MGQSLAGGAAGFEASRSSGGSSGRRADDLRAILRALEVRLASPKDVAAVGEAYYELYRWTNQHQADADLAEVLERLEPEAMYPEWRRQALEDAYVLFYEDVKRLGGNRALEQLPPPPISYMNDFHNHSNQQDGDADGTTAGWYEYGSRFWKSLRWDYEIRETAPVPVAIMARSPKLGMRDHEKMDFREARGREIVAKGRSARYCACAADPFCNLLQSAVSGHQGQYEEEMIVDTMRKGDGKGYQPEPRGYGRQSGAGGRHAGAEGRGSVDSVGSVQREPQLKPRLSIDRREQGSRHEDVSPSTRLLPPLSFPPPRGSSDEVQGSAQPGPLPPGDPFAASPRHTPTTT